ncbi:hypothetical protein KIK84_15510 [Curvibacter sp. CHRR-16]|uniref:pilus assembly PilX family protein n=1 Tax=Curvibacter sp. CHRR-16 TaxID=2835872 RepID=UPI001BD925BB|nr:hypothetical protein [Curvibacter sp. CHRR-16]MBT0571730.1 hypothetical protein [Curvibacter sp. CHRR-16]
MSYRLRNHPFRVRSQRGDVLIITLICLVIMLIASIALSRSSTNTLLQAGNFAFRSDLSNQGERAMAQAVYLLQSGSLASSTVRQSNQTAYNYSASQLSTNDQGIPSVLVSDSSYSTAGFAQTDFSDSSAGVTIRTVIDRQCSSTGAPTSSTCVYYVPDSSTALTGTARLKRVQSSGVPTYRITVRVTGPRNTQIFQQMIVGL